MPARATLEIHPLDLRLKGTRIELRQLLRPGFACHREHPATSGPCLSGKRAGRSHAQHTAPGDVFLRVVHVGRLSILVGYSQSIQAFVRVQLIFPAAIPIHSPFDGDAYPQPRRIVQKSGQKS